MNAPGLALGRQGFRAVDVALVVLVIAIVSLMVIPVPVLLLDALIAVNIMLSLGLLMMAAYVPSSLALSTFPTLLLFTTLLRLSLNIASTKVILLEGQAGHIIETFGRLVVGGNVFVGLVVFVVIAIVQFIVIAKGSERVAEVGARFSLDGMPGKQMSIDADLRAGLISKEVAQAKRLQVEKESQLNGAMDGAMKFVKGDAVAGLVITAVNVLGGIAVGMLMKGMAIGDAADRYILLSVGDGLVSQIPSLFVSIAAGVLITRVASAGDSGSDLGADVSRQLTAQPTALLFTGGMMLLFVLVPGFPKLVFALLGVLLIAAALVLQRRVARPRDPGSRPVRHLGADAQTEPAPFLRPDEPERVAPLALELAADDVARVDVARFDEAMGAMRARVKRLSGLPFPGLVVRTAADLAPGRVRLRVNEIPVGEGAIPWGQAAPALAGAPALRPAGDLFAAEAEPDADAGGVAPADAESWCACVVGRAWLRHGEQFIGMQEVQRLLDGVAGSLPGLVEEVMRTLPLQRVTDVMRRLVQEHVNVLYLREILESLVTWGPREKDVVMLTEYVRIDLGRITAFRFARGRETLPCIVVGMSVEAEMRAAIQHSQAGNYLALSPEQTSRIVQLFKDALEAAGLPPRQRVVLCSMDVRRYVRKLLSQSALDVPVLSHQELGVHVQVQAAAQVEGAV